MLERETEAVADIFRVTSDLKEGDVVLVISPETPRGRWPMGRIEKIHKGKDGRVSVASVRVKDTTYTRSITKLCPLEVDRA